MRHERAILVLIGGLMFDRLMSGWPDERAVNVHKNIIVATEVEIKNIRGSHAGTAGLHARRVVRNLFIGSLWKGHRNKLR